MIRFELRCERDHRFEGWFRSNTDFEASRTECPVCGSEKVEKALMTPALGRSAKKGGADNVQLASAPDPRQKALRQALKELRRHVTENADYVGGRFAEEARKIHYEEAEPRGIYGEATLDEAKALHEEGVSFQPLPSLPEDGN